MTTNFRQKSNVMMPSQEITSHANRTDTFQRAQEAPATTSKLGEVMNILNDVLPETAQSVTNEMTIALEADKVKQQGLAYVDARPSEDATEYGKSAHRAVESRNEVNVSQRNLQTLAVSFEGDDDEWNQLVQDEFTGLLERTGGSPEDMAVTGEMWAEQQSKAESIRYDSVQKQDQLRKYNTQHASYMESVLASDGDDVSSTVNIATSEAEEMGMTTAATEQAYIDAAISLADSYDDDRLIEHAKETGMFDRTPALQNAQRQLDGRKLAERNGDIARSAYNYEAEAYAGKYKDFDEFSREAEEARTDEDVPMHSASQIRSMWESSERRRNSDHQNQLVVDNMLNLDVSQIADRAEARMQDGTLDPVAFLNMDGPTTEAVIDELDQRWANELEKALEGAEEPEDQAAVISAHRQKRNGLLSENQLVDENMRTMFKDIEDFPIENMDGPVLTPQLYVGLSNFADLEETPSGLATHASAKAIAISDFYQKGKARGLNDVQAFSEAKRLANTKPARSGGEKEQKKFDSLVTDAIDGQYDHSFYEFWQPDSISDAHKELLFKDISSYARQLQAQNGNPERSVELATKAVLHNMTQLDNGHPVYGKPSWLGQQMGLPPNEAMAKLSTAAERISLLSAEDGFEHLNINSDVPFEEWIPKISSNGTMRFTDPEDNNVTSPILLSTLGGYTVKQKVQHIADREEHLTQSRKVKETYRKTTEQLKKEQETSPSNKRARAKQIKL